MFVGRAGSGLHGSGVPVRLSVRTKCITRAGGALPPFFEFEVDANCIIPARPSQFASLTLGIAGEDTSITADQLAVAIDGSPMTLNTNEAILSSGLLDGYTGIDEGAGRVRRPEGRDIWPVRFVSQRGDAVVREARCLLRGVANNGRWVFEGGYCSGAGTYRDIVFQVKFDPKPGSSERALTAQIATVLDDMLK